MSWNRAAQVTILAAWLLPPGANAGETASAIFRQFGLDGTWSPDCSHLPAANNPHVTWRLGDGGVVTHSVTLNGETYSLASEVSEAAILSESLIRFTIGRDGGASFVVTVERAGEKMRTLRSVGTEGRVYYEDGIDLASGKPSLFYERCGAAEPES